MSNGMALVIKSREVIRLYDAYLALHKDPTNLEAMDLVNIVICEVPSLSDSEIGSIDVQAAHAVESDRKLAKYLGENAAALAE